MNGEPMKNKALILVISLVAVLLCSSLASAQVLFSPSSAGNRTKAAEAAAKADPRPATYDKHDFTGIWYGRNPRVFSPKPPPMTPAGQKRFNVNKPSFGPR